MPVQIVEATPKPRVRKETVKKTDNIAVSGELLNNSAEDSQKTKVAYTQAGTEFDPVIDELEGTTQAWLRRAGRTRLLNHEQEVMLARRIEMANLHKAELQRRIDIALEHNESDDAAKDQDRLEACILMAAEAKETLVMANLRLVASVARRYLGHGMPIEDLMQEGTMGLMRAVDRFDYTKGHRFSTYAIWWIRRSISRAIADQSRLIRLPVHVTDTLGRINKTRGLMRERLGRTPTRTELASELSMTEDKLAELMRGAQEPLSLEAPIGEEGDSRLADLIPAADSVNPAQAAGHMALRDEIMAALDELTERERDVIMLRYGLDGDEARTLEEVGRALDVTRERVRQIESSALGKLRRPAYTQRIAELLN